MPSMNSELVTMAPAIDAFTRSNMPARNAVIAMTSSVRLPSVAFSKPPTASPVFAATLSVAWLSRAARGTMAQHGEHEQHRVRLRRVVLADEHRGHGGEQPQQRIRAQALERACSWRTGRSPGVNGRCLARGSCRCRSDVRRRSRGSRNPCWSSRGPRSGDRPACGRRCRRSRHRSLRRRQIRAGPPDSSRPKTWPASSRTPAYSAWPRIDMMSLIFQR